MPARPDLLRSAGRRIAEIRRLRGLTQEGLAAKLSIGVKNLQRIELGQNLTLRSVALIAEALEVHPSELLRDVGSPLTGTPIDPLAALRAAGLTATAERGSDLQVPVLSLAVAAGQFRAGASVDVLGYATVPGRRGRPPTGTFIAQVVGDSMQPLIPRGSYCVFGPVGASELVGRVVLVEHRALVDADTGGSFAVKKVGAITTLRSGRRRVRLDPVNGRYKPHVIELAHDEEFRPIAALVTVLPRAIGVAATAPTPRTPTK